MKSLTETKGYVILMNLAYSELPLITEFGNDYFEDLDYIYTIIRINGTRDVIFTNKNVFYNFCSYIRNHDDFEKIYPDIYAFIKDYQTEENEYTSKKETEIMKSKLNYQTWRGQIQYIRCKAKEVGELEFAEKCRQVMLRNGDFSGYYLYFTLKDLVEKKSYMVKDAGLMEYLENIMYVYLPPVTCTDEEANLCKINIMESLNALYETLNGETKINVLAHMREIEAISTELKPNEQKIYEYYSMTLKLVDVTQREDLTGAQRNELELVENLCYNIKYTMFDHEWGDN